MDSDEPGSGGSTPLQDEPEYEGSSPEEDGAGPQTPGSGSSGPQSVERDEQVSDDEQDKTVVARDDGDDYISDGGEVEREEVQRDVDDDDEDVEREEVERGEVDDDQPYQPGESDREDAGSASHPGSPRSGSDGSPPASPMSSAGGPQSPRGSGPQSPAGSGPRSPDSPMSVDGSEPGSRPQSPAGSGPGSPDGSQRSGSVSPTPSASGPQSPASGPQSPASGPRSPASGPQSPASGPRSPASGPQSPASGPQSPASGPQSPASGPRSPTSEPRSPDGSEPRSPASEPRPPTSPMFSAPNSPTNSPLTSNIESFLQDDSQRSRSPSPVRERSGGQSPSYSPRSGSSRAASPAGSGPATPSFQGSPRSPGDESDKENNMDSDDDRHRPKTARRIISDDESDREDAEPEEKKKAKDSDDEDSGKESGADELIADIFGSSDEDEEFEGFGEADVEAHAKKKEKKKAAIEADVDAEGSAEPEVLPELSDDENEDAVRKDGEGSEFVSDFEVMLQRKKEERQRLRRKRKDIDMINDNDDLIADMIGKMKLAAEDDRELNKKKQAATKKLKLLPWVMSQLMKSDLHSIFLDSGILSGMCEWLAPLPDKSLPHLTIRESLLKILIEFPPISSDSLKMSGIGKAIMYLYKHPRELRPNKERAGKLINEWSRPIFNLTSNYKTLSREERETRDYEQLPKKRKLSLEGSQTPRRDIDNAMEGEQKALRPGDPGWVYRARVPQPSHKDYVVRPKSDIEYTSTKKSTGKKDITRYEKHVRSFAEKKKFGRDQKAVPISIEGRNMAL